MSRHRRRRELGSEPGCRTLDYRRNIRSGLEANQSSHNAQRISSAVGSTSYPPPLRTPRVRLDEVGAHRGRCRDLMDRRRAQVVSTCPKSVVARPRWAPRWWPTATIRARCSTTRRTSSGTEGFQIEVAADLVLPRVTFFRRPLTDPNTGQYIHFDGASNTNSVVVVPYIGASYRVEPARRDRARGRCTVRCVARFSRPTVRSASSSRRSRCARSRSARRSRVEVAPGLAIGASANVIYADLVLDQRNAMPYVTGDPEQYPDPQGELQGTTHLAAQRSVQPRCHDRRELPLAGRRVRGSARA